MRQLVRPGIIIALYALLLPVVGPLLDHHYAEWQHNHDHGFYDGWLGAASGFHLHVYETGGSHSHTPLTDSAETPGFPDGVAYFTSYDSAGAGPIYSTNSLFGESMCFPDPGDGLLLASFAGDELLPPGATTAPPRKPPPA